MARQSVARLGATIDTATPAEVEQIIQNALSQQYVQQYLRKKGVIKLNAGGNGTTVGSEMALELKASSQYDWLLDRVTIGGPGAPSSIVRFYENDPSSDTGLLEVVGLGTAGQYSDGFSNNIYVPANTQIVITVTGGVAGQDVTINLQIKLKERQPRS